MCSALKSNEWQRIWVFQVFNTEIQKGDQLIQRFCRIGSSQEISSPSLISENFRKLRKTLWIHVKYI